VAAIGADNEAAFALLSKALKFVLQMLITMVANPVHKALTDLFENKIFITFLL
jgi:hypothetical protein